MPDTLTQLIAKVQAQLLDGGTLFTTATCTAAIRQALAHINRHAPQQQAVTITTVAAQREYELSDEDAAATLITDVLLQGSNDDRTSLHYFAYVEDGRWFFRLASPLAAGRTLDILYTRPHTITGLDGAGDSTLTDELNVAAIDGACYYACLIRAAFTVEANNVEEKAAQNWMELAAHWQEAFDRDLSLARRQPTPVGDNAQAAWNDGYHDTQYP
jgi:hypothetical protein